MTQLGDFQLERLDDDWNLWRVSHNGQKVMDVSADVAKGIMLRRYDVAALAEGRLVKVKKVIETKGAKRWDSDAQ